jgi:transcriptional regulator with XRE-family HTH domain
MKKAKSSAAVFFKSKRKDQGLTQDEVARFLGYTSKQIVSNWERGLCTPPLASLARLAKLLKIEKADIIEVFLNETEITLEKQFERKASRKKKSA